MKTVEYEGKRYEFVKGLGCNGCDAEDWCGEGLDTPCAINGRLVYQLREIKSAEQTDIDRVTKENEALKQENKALRFDALQTKIQDKDTGYWKRRFDEVVYVKEKQNEQIVQLKVEIRDCQIHYSRQQTYIKQLQHELFNARELLDSLSKHTKRLECNRKRFNRCCFLFRK